PESTIIIEFLDAHYPGSTRFLPADVDRAWQTRMWDRFYDHYVQEPMQKIVADRLRPEGKADAYGGELAKAQLQQAYGVMEREMESKTWAIGDHFTLADCSAAPALFYANTVVPFAETHKNLAAYLDRLMARPSLAAMNGVPMTVIAANLGHIGTRTTEKHYAHLSDSHVRDAIRAGAPRFGIRGSEKILPLR